MLERRRPLRDQSLQQAIALEVGADIEVAGVADQAMVATDLRELQDLATVIQGA